MRGSNDPSDQRQQQQQQQQQTRKQLDQHQASSNYINDDEKSSIRLKLGDALHTNHNTNEQTDGSKKANTNPTSNNGDISANSVVLLKNTSLASSPPLALANKKSLDTSTSALENNNKSSESLSKKQPSKMDALKDNSMHTIKEEPKTLSANSATDIYVNNEQVVNTNEQRKKIILGKGYSLMDWIR